MSMTVYRKHNYTRKDLKYIKNTPIIEYDMSNAGINILLTNGKLNQEFVDYLNTLDKLTKNITVGKILQNNPEWNKLMMEEFIKIRGEFMRINNLDDNDILSIKKDAIFVINHKVKKLKVHDNYVFREKGVYDTYLNIRNKEFYINIEKGTYDVKGFPKTVTKVQEDFFIDFIITCAVLEKEDRFDLFQHIKIFRSKFLNFELPQEFYYDLDEDGYKYKYCKDSIAYLISSKPPSNLKLCNIDNNYKYLSDVVNTLL